MTMSTTKRGNEGQIERGQAVACSTRKFPPNFFGSSTSVTPVGTEKDHGIIWQGLREKVAISRILANCSTSALANDVLEAGDIAIP